MQGPSVSWHIIAVKVLNWNIICFGQREPINVQFLRLFRALMKVHAIPFAIFETTRWCFIQIFKCLVSWKINPLYSFSSNLNTFDKDGPSNWKFWTFNCLGKSSLNSSCHIWNYKSVFLYNLHQSSMPREITLMNFLSWNFILFLQEELIKVQNFRLSTAQVKFHQICTLIGSFFLKVYKVSTKKAQRNYV